VRRRHDGFVVRSSPADVLEDPLARNPVVSGPIPVLSVLNAVERDGAFMEPSGRNRWQPVANGAAAKVAQTGE